MLRRGDALFASQSSFVVSVADTRALPEADIPEVAFAGRSNVGKSSLLNALLGRKALVKTSKTPGHTRLLNFFALGGHLHLVDMPGYGYAKAAKDDVAKWQRLGRNYLKGRKHLRLLCLLIDSRRGMLENDKAFCKELDKAAVGYLIILTKCDKLNEVQADKLRRQLTGVLGKFSAAYPHIFMTSSVSNMGLSELRAHIAQVIEFGG